MSAARRKLKVALAASAVVVAIGAIAGGFLFAWVASDKEDTFYILGAEPADPDYLSTLDREPEDVSRDQEHFGFAVHRLKRGTGVIFGYRFYSPGTTMIDDEGYRKLSVWIPSGLPGAPVDLDLGDRGSALVMYSSGGSAWPSAECSGYVSSGRLRVERHGARYAVSVHGQLEPHAKARARKHCLPEAIDVEFEARELAFERLTPWLGAAGTHPYQETYR